MSDLEEAAMSDGGQSKDEKMQELLKGFLMNEEYKRVICVREGCGVGLELGGVRIHLKARHKMKKTVALKVQRRLREAGGGQSWGLYEGGRPEDGLRPQEGLAVVDRIRCLNCYSFTARTVREMSRHWLERHEFGEVSVWEDMEGRLWKRVRMQSWGGRLDGEEEEYWEVEDSEEKMEEKAEEKVEEVEAKSEDNVGYEKECCWGNYEEMCWVESDLEDRSELDGEGRDEGWVIVE